MVHTPADVKLPRAPSPRLYRIVVDNGGHNVRPLTYAWVVMRGSGGGGGRSNPGRKWHMRSLNIFPCSEEAPDTLLEPLPVFVSLPVGGTLSPERRSVLTAR